MTSGLNKIYQYIEKNEVFPGCEHLQSVSSNLNCKTFINYAYLGVNNDTQQISNTLKRKLSSSETTNEIENVWYACKRSKLSECPDEKDTSCPSISKYDMKLTQKELSFEIQTCWLGSYGFNRESGMSATFRMMKNGGFLEMDSKIKGQTCRVNFSIDALRTFFLSRFHKFFVFTLESKFAACLCKQMKLASDDLDYRKNSPLNCVFVRFTNKLNEEDYLFLEKTMMTCHPNKSLNVNVNWPDEEAMFLLNDIGIKARPEKPIVNQKKIIQTSKLIARKSPVRKNMDIRPLLTAFHKENKPTTAAAEDQTPQAKALPVDVRPVINNAPNLMSKGRAVPNPKFRSGIQWESMASPVSISTPIINKASASVSRMSSLLLPGNRMPTSDLSKNSTLPIHTQNTTHVSIIAADNVSQVVQSSTMKPAFNHPGPAPPAAARMSRLVARPASDAAISKPSLLCQAGQQNTPSHSQFIQSNKSELKLSHSKGVNIPYFVINKLPNNNSAASSLSVHTAMGNNGFVSAMSNCSIVDSARPNPIITTANAADSRIQTHQEFIISDQRNHQGQSERVINSSMIDVSSSPSLQALINSSPLLQQNPNIVFTTSNPNSRFEMLPPAMAPRITEEVIESFTYKPDDSRDGIKLVNEDIMCLNEGNYVNDSIINFYLKYVFHELITPQQRERTHIFNCFFYNKLKDIQHNNGPLSGKTSDESEALARHSSVKRWTRSVDIFDKDFIIIPINENSHWFLAIVCYAWMSGTISYTELFQSSNKLLPTSSVECIKPDYIQDPNTGASQQFKMKQLARIMKIRQEQNVDPYPCILLFDSLIGTPRSPNVKIIRDYLQVEWITKRAERDGNLTFDKDTVRGFSPHVPQQPNFSDCGTYVLHYAENFFSSPVKSYTKEYFQKNMSNWFPLDSVKGKRGLIQDLIIDKYKKQKKINDSLKQLNQNAGNSNFPSSSSSSSFPDEECQETITVIREHIPEPKPVPKLECATHSQVLPVMVQQFVQQSSSSSSAYPIIIASPTSMAAATSPHIKSSNNSL